MVVEVAFERCKQCVVRLISEENKIIAEIYSADFFAHGGTEKQHWMREVYLEKFKGLGVMRQLEKIKQEIDGVLRFECVRKVSSAYYLVKMGYFPVYFLKKSDDLLDDPDEGDFEDEEGREVVAETIAKSLESSGGYIRMDDEFPSSVIFEYNPGEATEFLKEVEEKRREIAKHC